MKIIEGKVTLIFKILEINKLKINCLTHTQFTILKNKEIKYRFFILLIYDTFTCIYVLMEYFLSLFLLFSSSLSYFS